MADCALPSPSARRCRTTAALADRCFQYWVVFAFFTVTESFFNIVYWFPFYFVFKFVFLLWLSLPMFRYVSPVSQPCRWTLTMT